MRRKRGYVREIRSNAPHKFDQILGIFRRNLTVMAVQQRLNVATCKAAGWKASHSPGRKADGFGLGNWRFGYVRVSTVGSNACHDLAEFLGPSLEVLGKVLRCRDQNAGDIKRRVSRDRNRLNGLQLLPRTVGEELRSADIKKRRDHWNRVQRRPSVAYT
jgi:hypothetical protein